MKRLDKLLEQIDKAKIHPNKIMDAEFKRIAKEQAKITFIEGVLEVFDELAKYDAGYINMKELKKTFGVE